MATIRKRQTKNGITYDIQVKLKDKGSGKELVKTTTWRPEKSMTEKQEEKAAAIFADTFEEEMKKLLSSGASVIENPNVTFREFSDTWLEKILRFAEKDGTYSINHYEKSKICLADANRYIGGYKLKELTPTIIQSFYNKLDAREKTVVTVTPKQNFKENLASYGYNFVTLRDKKKIQSSTLANAFKGRTVSKSWAVMLCQRVGVAFEKLFDETETTVPYAHETIDKIKRTVRTVMSQAKKNCLIADNYASAEYIDFPPKPQKEVRCMDDGQAKIFFKTVMESESIKVKAGLLIFILTGMRRGEVAGLQWHNIDLERHTIAVDRSVVSISGRGKVIKQPKTKNSKRTFTMSKLLVDVLTKYKAWWDEQVKLLGDIVPSGTDWVFLRGDGGVICPQAFNSWLDKMLEKAGLEHFTVHSLRHTNITLQIAAGVPIVTVAARAGHARASITSDIYAHFIHSSDAEAAEKLDALFSE